MTVSGWLIAGVVLLGAAQRPQPKELTLEKLTIAGKNGLGRILLDVDKDGDANFTMHDMKGQARFMIVVRESYSYISFLNKFGHQKAAITEGDKGIFWTRFEPKSNEIRDAYDLDAMLPFVQFQPNDPERKKDPEESRVEVVEPPDR